MTTKSFSCISTFASRSSSNTLSAQDERFDSLVENADDNEAVEAYKLGKRLFANRSGPIAVYGLRPCYRPNKETSGAGDVVNPNDPALIVNQLESSKAGCEWLRDQWLELRRLLEPTQYWTGIHRLKAVRLLGRQPVDILEDDRVALIFFAAHRLNPVGDDPFSDLGTDIDSSLLGRLEIDAVTVWPDLIDASEEAPARELSSSIWSNKTSSDWTRCWQSTPRTLTSSKNADSSDCGWMIARKAKAFAISN